MISVGLKKRAIVSCQFHITSQHPFRGILKLFTLVKQKYGKKFKKNHRLVEERKGIYVIHSFVFKTL